MVIVNKKPPSKKVPLLIFQFPSPPTWNNWLSHLLNLYSFVINLYSFSSPLLSSNHFFVSSHLLLPSLSLSLFFFFFFFPQGHMKLKNGRLGSQRPILACFSGRIGWNQAVSVWFDDCFGLNWTISTVSALVSAGIGPNQSESVNFSRIEKKRRIGASHATSGQVWYGCSGPGAAPVLSKLQVLISITLFNTFTV